MSTEAKRDMKKAGNAGGSISMHSKIAGETRTLHSKVGKPSLGLSGGALPVARYADGGEVDDKAAGLAASSGEKVGFFERLRAGNIDDPNSEAYKRFGAGRGVQDRAYSDSSRSQDVTPSLDTKGGDSGPAATTGAVPEGKAETDWGARPGKTEDAPAKRVTNKAPKKAPVLTTKPGDSGPSAGRPDSVVFKKPSTAASSAKTYDPENLSLVEAPSAPVAPKVQKYRYTRAGRIPVGN